MNVVMTGAGKLVEVQGTAERNSFIPRRARSSSSALAEGGIARDHGPPDGARRRRAAGKAAARGVKLLAGHRQRAQGRRDRRHRGGRLWRSSAHDPDVEETGEMFEANALLKARRARRHRRAAGSAPSR